MNRIAIMSVGRFVAANESFWSCNELFFFFVSMLFPIWYSRVDFTRSLCCLDLQHVHMQIFLLYMHHHSDCNSVDGSCIQTGRRTVPRHPSVYNHHMRRFPKNHPVQSVRQCVSARDGEAGQLPCIKWLTVETYKTVYNREALGNAR